MLSVVCNTSNPGKQKELQRFFAMHGYQVIEVEKNQLAQIKLLFLKKSLAFSEAMYHDDTSYSHRLKYTHRDLFFVEFVKVLPDLGLIDILTTPYTGVSSSSPPQALTD